MIDLINFYRVNNIEAVREFYGDVLGLKLYKDQGKCLIYDCGHGKLGFCSHFPETNNGSCITFVYESREEVDKMYGKMRIFTKQEPVFNDFFKIYHFFVRDSNGLKLEFQYFMD